MAYTPTEWKQGDVVTSTKLNKMEQGIADAQSGGALTVHTVDGIYDATWQEIHDAIENGMTVTVFDNFGGGTMMACPVIFAVGGNNGYNVVGIRIDDDNVVQFIALATTADDYPSSSIK